MGFNLILYDNHHIHIKKNCEIKHITMGCPETYNYVDDNLFQDL